MQQVSNYPDYEGYEDLGRFTPSQLQSYRQMLLEKTQPQVEFIRKHVYEHCKEPWFDTIEIGCGNGRLEIALELSGMTDSATGIDISQSRIDFANKWASDLDLAEAFFDKADVLALQPDKDYYQLAICITGCFQYFYPIAPDAPQRVLKFMRNSATYGLFELYKRPPMGKTWKKLPEGDTWEYLLDEYKDTGEWVEHTKIFLGASDAENRWCQDRRTEHLKYYCMPEFLQLLNKAGYKEVLWAREDSSSMVVLAK